MGIHGLTKVIGDHAPGAIREADIKTFFGRKVAVDASMSIYQFLIAVRQQDGQQLVNEAGETTSHLMGLFYRTIRMAENGIKVLYCFDGTLLSLKIGKPPDMKSSELAKRGEKRQEAQNAVDAATEAGDVENIQKFEKRTVKVTKEHNQECQKLLGLMGIPFVLSPGEAEAQCAALAKAGIVYAAGSEDMDTLTFNSPFLLRHLTFSEARKMPIMEISLEKVLQGLEFTMDQFIDLCILLGCDYCDSIRGIGPTRAVQLLREHESIEGVLKALDPKKYKIPEDWPFEEARRLFKNPLVADPSELNIKWSDPDEEGLVQFLCKEKHFNEERVRKAVQKFAKAKSGGVQGRLDSFFKVLPKDGSQRGDSGKSNARKGEVGGKPKKKKK